MKSTPWEVDNEKFSYEYIAGFLDGDGSIVATLSKNPPHYNRIYRPRLKINFSQKTYYISMLEALSKFLKSGKLRTNSKKQLSELVITDRNDVLKILERILPHLVIKKDRAQIALEILKLFGTNDKNNRITDIKYNLIIQKIKLIRSLNSASGGKKVI